MIKLLETGTGVFFVLC